jgi:nucleoside-diphosphate-sugar epimerase
VHITQPHRKQGLQYWIPVKSTAMVGIYFVSLDRTFDITKAKNRLRWGPKVGLEEGARRGLETEVENRAEKRERKIV